MAVLEAMSCELPVISSNILGLNEIVENNKSGFLFDPGNIEELISKLSTLIEDEKLRKKMGRYGRKYVIQNFENSKILPQYKDLYLDLLQN